MKNYSTSIIKKYIEENKEKIKSVECGMEEDWSWTCGTVYADGKYNAKYDWEKETIEIAGIEGSTWATPIMKVNFYDGNVDYIECYKDDGEVEDQIRIATQKAFARATFGMDYVN